MKCATLIGHAKVCPLGVIPFFSQKARAVSDCITVGLLVYDRSMFSSFE